MRESNSSLYEQRIVEYQNLKYHELSSLIHDVQFSNPDSYLSSPLYYLLTGRAGFWTYRTDKSCLVTSTHPHSAECLLVFPEIGKNSDYRLTASVLKRLGVSRRRVQLARYTEDELNRLKYQLTNTNYEGSISVIPIEEDTMDWRYPVRILDTQKVTLMQGSGFAKIRNKVRRISDKIVTFPLYSLDNLKIMTEILQVWERNMIFNKKNTKDMLALYYRLFELLAHNRNSIDGLIFQADQRFIGFTAWDKSHPKIANLFANLSDTSIAGLSDFQLVTSCKKLVEHGISSINLGGSEIESLDAFKKKYCPVQTIPLLSARVLYFDVN